MQFLKIRKQIESGSFNFTPEEKRQIHEYISKLNGKVLTLIIQPGESIRAIAKNNFFHGPLIRAFIEASGMSNPSWWKAHLKQKFLSRQISNSKTGEIVLEIRGTSTLTDPEFDRFLVECKNYLYDEVGGVLDEEGEFDYQEATKKIG